MSSISNKDAEVALGKITNDNGSLGETELAEVINLLSERWSEELTGIYMRGVDGAPDWKEFEHNIWQLGEAIRPVIKRRKWRGRTVVLDEVARVLLDKKYGKGRQTFALILGDYGNDGYGAVLAVGLVDKDVCGHCIKALTKAKLYDYEDEVRSVFDDSSGWVKLAARKYLEISRKVNDK